MRVLDYLSVVERFARREVRRGIIEYDDAVQIGFLAILSAVAHNVTSELPEDWIGRLLNDAYWRARSDVRRSKGWTREGQPRGRLLTDPLRPRPVPVAYQAEMRLICQRFMDRVYPVMPPTYQHMIDFCLYQSESDTEWQAEYARAYGYTHRLVRKRVERMRHRLREMVREGCFRVRNTHANIRFQRSTKAPRLDKKTKQEIHRDRQAGMSVDAITRKYQVHRHTVYRICKIPY